MRFLIDNALSPLIAAGLNAAGHDALHVRAIDLQHAADDTILDRARQDDRVLVSADADFGAILAQRNANRPSVILFRKHTERRPDRQIELLLTNLPQIESALQKGAIVIFEESRLRLRLLPFNQV